MLINATFYYEIPLCYKQYIRYFSGPPMSEELIYRITARIRKSDSSKTKRICYKYVEQIKNKLEQINTKL